MPSGRTKPDKPKLKNILLYLRVFNINFKYFVFYKFSLNQSQIYQVFSRQDLLYH